MRAVPPLPVQFHAQPDQVLAARRAAGYSRLLTPKALAPLLDYLRGLGVALRAQVMAPVTPAGELLDHYCRWLLAGRGLRPGAARGYVASVRLFVTAQGGGGEAGLRAPGAGDVTGFMVAGSRRLAPETVQRLATALRSLLRFWHLEGLITGPLGQAVPAAACRPRYLPRALEPAQVQALLASCGLVTPEGLRDFAMMTLLARIGLRAGEVAALQLDDIGWRHGEITVRGKGEPARPAPAAR